MIHCKTDTMILQFEDVEITMQRHFVLWWPSRTLLGDEIIARDYKEMLGT